MLSRTLVAVILPVSAATLLLPASARADLRGDYFCNYYFVDGILTPDTTAFMFSRTDSIIDEWAAVTCNYVWGPVPECTNHFAVSWTGQIRIDVEGEYGFGTMSDDGSQLWIDGVLTVDNVEEQWWDWEDNLVEGSYSGLYPEGYGDPDSLTGPVYLTEGFHDIQLRMFEARYWDGIELWWLPPGSGPSDIPYYGISCASGGLSINAVTNWQIVPADVLSLPPTSAPVVPGTATQRLEPPRPNPARGSTVLAFSLRDPGAAELSVVDAAGRRVATLVTGRQASGRHEIRWAGRDARGRPLPSGVYFVALEVGDARDLRKVTLIR